MSNTKYPATLSIDYPNRELNKKTTFFRLIVAIPIILLLSSVSGAGASGGDGSNFAIAGGGLLFLGPLLMIVFRQKYPKWWFDWNLELMRFSSRVSAYLALMDDRYPSTDEKQSVTLDIKYPNVEKDLTYWKPLVKWFLAIPHYIALIVLSVASIFVIFYAWFKILITGRYPRPAFDFVEKVMQWNLRVTAYAFLLTTDEYPPFKLNS